MNYWEVSLMDCQIKITDNKAVWKIQAALALIFLLNPFLGVLSTLFFVFVSKEKSMAFYLVIILTLFMWCLQSTRSFHLGEPSDWAGNYYYNFHNAAITDTLKTEPSPFPLQANRAGRQSASPTPEPACQKKCEKTHSRVMFLQIKITGGTA